MIRVLIDYAHADLWESLELLLGDRLGYELYRPIGMEWFTDGIWQFESRLGDVVAKQFLAPWDTDQDAGNHSLREDTGHPGRTIKMVTLEQARSQPWDLVIATLAENEPGLCRFARERGATYGIQVGNQGAPNVWGAAQFAMLSVTTPGFKPWIPTVTYHQEFDLELFRPEWPPAERDLVATRVQCITETPDYKRFTDLAEQTPELRWRHYGHCGARDDRWGGDTPTTPEIAEQMRAAGIAYHVKRWSDGYGHVIHNWFAIGRPVIGSSGYYADKLAGPLFIEGVTSFDVDRRGDAELVELVRRLATDDDLHRSVSEAAAVRFREVVDFGAEADAIRTMLEAGMSDRVTA